MQLKNKEKFKAIKLRKDGLSYSEILEQVKVARSTLSLWLRSVALSKPQSQRLTEKKLKSMMRGAQTRRKQRIDSSNAIYQKSGGEIGNISSRELLLIGSALYWAEGSKQKEHNVSQGIIFGNSDPNMVRLFLVFAKNVLGVQDNAIKFELYIHRNGNVPRAVKYWAGELREPIKKFSTVYFKNGNANTKRKNISENYHGLIRVRILKSTSQNRRITGWIQGIVKHCGIV
ncbi:MAG: helix-turn-helix domain-containing protein [bacterium]|nr:helix-turn-helix domain-containing protein [bacterium]